MGLFGGRGIVLKDQDPFVWDIFDFDVMTFFRGLKFNAIMEWSMFDTPYRHRIETSTFSFEDRGLLRWTVAPRCPN
jgi:hypothetical protein